MKEFDQYLKDRKQEVYETASKNTTYDENGRAVIPKDDEWTTETEWDEQ